jgi:uncharacterized protein (TIGR02246 family)
MSIRKEAVKEVTKLFSAWNAALESGDPDRIVALYASNAVLLPTLSNQVRKTHSEIRDYFEKMFMPKNPSGRIVDCRVRVFGDVAVSSGVFAFKFADGGVAHVRKSFVYHWNGDEWLIAEHHSSLMPEPVAVA